MSSPPRRPLGETGLSCHPFGFGSYRVLDGNPEHESAVVEYLDRGGNLIDASANYGDGGAEELIGRVVEDFQPDDLILVTKGGYIQGRNLELAERRQFPEVVEYGVGIQHSIHPEFLETQVELSLERLRAERVDVYLLHNPEYFLEDIAHRRPVTADDHDEFYRRVREAFRYLEAQVEAGRIGCYGVSSNNFIQPAPESEQAPTTATSVARCLEAAREVAENHRFRVVQLPLNLFESGGVLSPNTAGEPALAFCRKNGLAVLANRPLNAFHENRLVRLADPPREDDPDEEPTAGPLERLRGLERDFAGWAGEQVELPSGEAPSALFERILPQLEAPAQWAQVGGRVAVEPIQTWLNEAGARLADKPELNAWRERFVEAVNEVFEGVRADLERRRQSEADQVRERLLRAGYPRRQDDEPLSRMALRTLASLDGLSCTLVGMRRREYVDDVFEAVDADSVDGPGILERFAQLE